MANQDDKKDKPKDDQSANGKGPISPPGQDKHFTILVNGRKKQVKESSLSYAEVVKLAFPNDKTGTGYTITYSNSVGGMSGSLTEGQSVKIQDGTEFDVSATTKS